MRIALALCACLAAAAPHAARAAESFAGKWAASASDCKIEPLFTLTAKSFTGVTLACESASFKPDGKGWKGSLRQCSAEGEDGGPVDMAVGLAIEGGKLQITWGDGTKSGRMARCR